MTHPDVTTILAVITTGTVGQILLIAARAMPAPPANANYVFRWFYDFVQGCAVNADKIGAVKPVATLPREPSIHQSLLDARAAFSTVTVVTTPEQTHSAAEAAKP